MSDALQNVGHLPNNADETPDASKWTEMLSTALKAKLTERDCTEMGQTIRQRSQKLHRE